MDRLRRVPVWAWLALALALRAAFALHLDGRTIQTDELAFDEAAWSLATTGRLSAAGPGPAPLAPFFFSLFYLLGHCPVRARLAQAVLSTFTAWLLGRAASEWTGSEDAGLLALAIAAVYPFFVYYSGTLLSETLYVALTVWGVWELGRSAHGAATPAAARAGLALGLAALARPEGAFVWAVIWLLAAGACAARAWPWKAWAVALTCWALPILGWCARNQAQTGRFALDLHGGTTLLHGTMFLELNEIDTSLAAAALERQPYYQEARKLGPAEGDRLLEREAFEFMREHPRRVLRQWGVKLVNFWRLWPRLDKGYRETDFSHPGAGLSRLALVGVSLAFEPWLVVLGLCGLLLLARRDWTTAPLPLFVLGTMGIHVLSVSQMRYRLPAMPWLIVGASWVLARGWRPAPPGARPKKPS